MIAAAVMLVAAAPAASAQAEVMAAMEASGAGWNANDLDRFMAVYANDAIMVTSKGLLSGKAAIADKYRPSFAAGGNTRGKLRFEGLAYRTLSKVHALLFARWILTTADGKTESGYTTLTFERRPEGWRIISDHSS